MYTNSIIGAVILKLIEFLEVNAEADKRVISVY